MKDNGYEEALHSQWQSIIKTDKIENLNKGKVSLDNAKVLNASNSIKYSNQFDLGFLQKDLIKGSSPQWVNEDSMTINEIKIKCFNKPIVDEGKENADQFK